MEIRVREEVEDALEEAGMKVGELVESQTGSPADF